MFDHVLIESSGCFQIICIALRIAAPVGKLLISTVAVESVLNGCVVADWTLLSLLFFNLGYLHCFYLFNLILLSASIMVRYLCG